MGKLVEFELEEGGVVLVEVDEKTAPSGMRPVADTGAVGRAQHTFGESVSMLAPVCNAMLSRLTTMLTRPDEITVELGFKLSGKGTLILVSSEGEASFKARLLWKRPSQAVGGQADEE